MLKDGSSTPFWIRNLQMYSCGAVTTAFGCLVYEGRAIADKGFFYGYNRNVVAIVGWWLFNNLIVFYVLRMYLVMKNVNRLNQKVAESAFKSASYPYRLLRSGLLVLLNSHCKQTCLLEILR